MDISIKNFIETLYTQKAIYEEFIALALQKKQALIDNDLQKINEITSKEGHLVKKAKQAEDARQLEALRAADVLGIKSHEATLSNIAQATDAEAGRKLYEIKESLSVVVSELMKLNDINKELINTHISYTNFSIEIMTQSTVSAETYGGNGYVNEDKNTRIGLIDQKV